MRWALLFVVLVSGCGKNKHREPVERVMRQDRQIGGVEPLEFAP